MNNIYQEIARLRQFASLHDKEHDVQEQIFTILIAKIEALTERVEKLEERTIDLGVRMGTLP